MDANKELRVFEKLCTFKFGTRTDVKKRILNNHDAAAFLFWHLGPTTSREMIALLRRWRWVDTGNGLNLSYTYLFNTCVTSGYGFVAKDVMSRGNFLQTYSYGSKTKSFRRTYWFRAERGLYVATVECAKRITELGLGGEIK